MKGKRPLPAPPPRGGLRLTPTELGRAAYLAYRGAMRGVNPAGNELPVWDGLTNREQIGWEVAAERAVRLERGHARVAG